MERNVGTVSRGIRCPIIREGDNIGQIVVDSLLRAGETDGFEVRDRDVVCVTESVVARAQGNYASVDAIAADVKAKLGGETVPCGVMVRGTTNADLSVHIYWHEAEYEIRLESSEGLNSHDTLQMAGKAIRTVIRRMMADGCELGNHSWSHPQLNKLSAGEVRSQINRTNDAIAAVAGHGATVMRCPYGATGGSVKSVLGDMGYASILWSIDTLDWKTRNADSTVNSVLNNVKDGDIVLMHSIYSQTAAAVERIVPALVQRGFQLVTVSELAAARGGMTPGKNYGSFRR